MAAILATLICVIAACYLLRWGSTAIIKRQRIDWPGEREHLKQHLELMLRIMHRLSRYMLHGGRHPSLKSLGKPSGHSH